MEIMLPPDFYEEDPRNNGEYSSEDQILVKIEEQFKISENNVKKEDLMKIYLKDLVQIDLDQIELYQVEMKIENEDQRDTFDYLMTQMKFLFNKYFGIDSADLELDVADFEFVYNLYNLFVLELNKTLVDFLCGLKSKSNNLVSNPDLYTLQGGYKEYLAKLNPIPVISQESFSIESLQELNKSIDKMTQEDIDGLNNYVNSAQAFLDLCNRSIMDDHLLDIDVFFEILYMGDPNDVYLKFLTLVNDGTIPFDIFIFRERIRGEIFLPENLDAFENIYRERLSIHI